MNREMLGSRNRLQIMLVVALDTLDEPGREHAGEVGILAQRLLAPTPARIAENIDVRRPEGQTEIAVVISLALRLIVARATFDADHVALGMEQLLVPSRCHSDRLRKDRRLAAARD